MIRKGYSSDFAFIAIINTESGLEWSKLEKETKELKHLVQQMFI